ncbi:MAG: DedA family protein [Phycisphaeraceae bacterium]|nr:DedA family protein [Phycisphaeraceae bacterium]
MTDTTSTNTAATAAAATAPVPRWALHRRLYDWTVSLAHSRHANWSLFLLSFAESSFFPIPPDVLLAPLCLGKRSKAWWFAGLCTVASVLGAILGYAIGVFLWELINPYLFQYVPGFTQENYQKVVQWYEAWGIWCLFLAAFSPIPFKVFTIAGGVLRQSIPLFIVVSAIGRGLRFFAVAWVFARYGERAKPFIEKYFNWLCLAFAALLIGGFVLIKYLH